MDKLLTKHADGKVAATAKGRLATIFLFIIAGTLAIPLYAQFYTSNVSEMRYCDDPEAVVMNLEFVLRSDDPLAQQSGRSLVVASKLLFLVPRYGDEEVPQYLTRVRAHLAGVCGKGRSR